MNSQGSPSTHPARRKAIGLAVLLALCAAGPAVGQASREYSVKAAFLYNFATFVEWPAPLPPAGAPFVIGVLGDDPFGATLDEIVAGERVAGHPMVVRRFSRAEDVHSCQILFISASESHRLPEILRRFEGQPVLTVSDLPGFAGAGGGIQFITDTRVGIIIDPAALRAAGLGVSSKLLRLARVVREGAAPP